MNGLLDGEAYGERPAAVEEVWAPQKGSLQFKPAQPALHSRESVRWLALRVPNSLLL
jgi:hypothetical protein